MDLQEMYSAAVGIIENLRTAGGNYSVSENSSVCILLALSGRVYSGLTGTAFENGVVKTSCPEHNAIVSMMNAGETRIAKMMTVMFRNGEVVLPCEECRNLIFRINSENSKCEIAVSKSGTIALEVLMPRSISAPQPVNNNINNINNNINDNIPQPDNDMMFEDVPGQQDDSSESDSKYSFGFASSGGNVFKSPEKVNVETAGGFFGENKKDDSSVRKESGKSSVDYVNNIMADENNPFYDPPIENESNIVRDGNIEFEVYNPNKPAKIPKPKALNQLPNSSQNSGSGNNHTSSGYYNGSYGTDGYYNPSPGYADPINSDSSGEQYQSPYKHSSTSENMSSYYSSGELESGNAMYKQKLSSILDDASPSKSSNSNSQQTTSGSVKSSSPAPPEKLSKFEMFKMAREKKKLAKIDAKFQKKIKKKGL